MAPDLSALSPPPARIVPHIASAHVLAEAAMARAMPPPPPPPISLTYNTKTWEVLGQEDALTAAGAASAQLAARVVEENFAREAEASKAARAKLPKSEKPAPVLIDGEKPPVAIGVAGFRMFGARAAAVARAASPPKGPPPSTAANADEEIKDVSEMNPVKPGTAGANVAEARRAVSPKPKEHHLFGAGHVSLGPKPERQAPDEVASDAQADEE